jgi:NAD(P)-dependent dehydrogenase (short-subunit alcohol dehydrogenase family)
MRFSLSDLELFSAASHDRNPLHLSKLYARNTPYGERVIFGVLGGLACLGRSLNGQSPLRLTTVSLEFLHPIYPGIDYSVETTEVSSEEVRVKLSDGRRALLKTTYCFDKNGGALAAASTPDQITVTAHRADAVDLDDEDLVVGYTTKGAYAPSYAHLRRLAERLGLIWNEIDPAQMSALMLSSYLVGMELPGARALFSKLTLDFGASAVERGSPLSYEAKIISFDRRFAFLRIDARISMGSSPVARADLRAFVRPHSPTLRTINMELNKTSAINLAGKVALVIGASRGLGAATALALASQGCTVFVNFWRNRAKAEELKTLASPSGRIVLLQGDAGNPGWCEKMKDIIIREQGKLDYLVCNACLPLRPLRIEGGAVRRINDYVARSLALVSIPMAVFLETLAESAGRNVVISSDAVQSAPADWPHYVSAKWAIEGLTRAAAAEYERVSFTIVRPPRLMTDLSNTPLARMSAISPSIVANAIVKSLRKTPANQVKILENFREPTLSVPRFPVV